MPVIVLSVSRLRNLDTSHLGGQRCSIGCKLLIRHYGRDVCLSTESGASGRALGGRAVGRRIGARNPNTVDLYPTFQRSNSKRNLLRSASTEAGRPLELFSNLGLFGRDLGVFPDTVVVVDEFDAASDDDEDDGTGEDEAEFLPQLPISPDCSRHVDGSG